MHDILQRLLVKRSIKDVTRLTDDEKTDFDRWQKILSQDEITVDKIKEFCLNQLRSINVQLRNVDNSNNKNDRLICLHNVYSTLIEVIEAPQSEKENLEKYLNNLLE